MRIVVAMSGGVDSSVVAGLLHEAGHEVIGMTLQLYDHGPAKGRKGACCAGADIADARNVADRLGIAHYVIDAEARFRKAVIDDFADSYAAGETPVPCIRCNQSVKFTDLLGMARDLGAEAMATGHYVRRVVGRDGPQLHRAIDRQRDQSWFLFATTRDQLAFSRFPLGDMPDKSVVRAHAARLGLDVAEKADSQDLCFVPSGSYSDLVGKLRPEATAPGDIVNLDGRILAQHSGLGQYTVGQAKRLGDATFDGGTKQIVVGLDPARRRVVVGSRASAVRSLALRDVNWLAEHPSATGLQCSVKLRAGDAMRQAVVTATSGGMSVGGASIDEAEIVLDEPALPAPGQACVFYDGDRVLGGGFIKRSSVFEAADAGAVAAMV